MALIPSIQPEDWDQVDRNFKKLIKFFIGPDAKPQYTGLTLTGLTADSLIYPDSNKLLTSLGVASNGQLPIGSTGATPVLAEITGTANQITSTPGAGSITLSTPQDIHTAASPTFAALNLGTGELTAGSINRAAGALTLEIAGTSEVSITSSTITLGGNLVIPDAGYIGATSDTDAMQIEADGDIVFSQGVTINKAASSEGLKVASAIVALGDASSWVYGGAILDHVEEVSTSDARFVAGDPTGSADTRIRLHTAKAGTFGLFALIVDEDANVGIGRGQYPNTKLTVAGAITLLEQASADADTVAYGQIWVKNAAPCELWFTTDVGNDIQLTSGTITGAHTHDGDTLQLDAVNSDGGAFSFATTGLVTFNQNIAAVNYAAANLLTAAATNAGEIDFTFASKKLDVEDSAVVSQDYSSDASPTFAGLSLGTGELTTGSINRVSGTLTLEVGGTAEISITSTTSTFGGNLIIPDTGYIGSVSDTDAIQIEADGDIVLTQKLGIGGTPSKHLHIISSTYAEPTFTLECTHNTSPGGQVVLYLNSSSPADDELLGSLQFDGKDSAGNITPYGIIRGYGSDVTSGNEGGQLKFVVFSGGHTGAAGERILLTVGGEDVAGGNAPEIHINPAAMDCNFHVEADGVANALFIEGSNGYVGINDGSPSEVLDVNGNINTTGVYKVDDVQVLDGDTLILKERSSDPTEPTEGFMTIWMSDGTGYGDDGDVCIAAKAGGATTKAILFDKSAGDAW